MQEQQPNVVLPDRQLESFERSPSNPEPLEDVVPAGQQSSSDKVGTSPHLATARHYALFPQVPAPTALNATPPQNEEVPVAPISSTSHSKEWKQLERVAKGPRATTFPEITKMFTGTKAERNQVLTAYVNSGGNLDAVEGQIKATRTHSETLHSKRKLMTIKMMKEAGFSEFFGFKFILHKSFFPIIPFQCLLSLKEQDSRVRGPWWLRRSRRTKLPRVHPVLGEPFHRGGHSGQQHG